MSRKQEMFGSVLRSQCTQCLLMSLGFKIKAPKLLFLAQYMNRPRVRKVCTTGDKGKPVSSTQSQSNATCVLGDQHDGHDGKGGTVNNMMGKMEDKDNNMRTR